VAQALCPAQAGQRAAKKDDYFDPGSRGVKGNWLFNNFMGLTALSCSGYWIEGILSQRGAQGS
jgi:hypothetical protein